MSDWLLVIIAIVGGLFVGLVASRLVYSFVGSAKRPVPIQQVAKPLSSLALSIGLVIGIVIALGIMQPSALEQLPKDLVSWIPKLLSAALILIIANVLASFATTAVAQATGRMPLQIQRQASLVVRTVIMVLAIVLAVGQLGVDTEIVNMALGSVFFGLAASLTLLVGLGGNGVAREVASTRVLKRMLKQGDTVAVGNLEGVVAAVHPTAVELTSSSGESILVPSSRFLGDSVSIQRIDQPAKTSNL